MRIIDCFIHPVGSACEQSLFSVDDITFKLNISNITNRMSSLNVSHAIVAMFQAQRIYSLEELSCDKLTYTILADFQYQDSMDRLFELYKKGIRSIFFHPYLQNFTRDAWPSAISFAREASRLGMFVCVCTAYGGPKLYRNEVLPFAQLVAEAVKCPVVLVHCGGAKILEAMLIADVYPNIYLETSFTLSYWLGSSVELDIAYAMRKLGVSRWLFGSDAPFVPMDIAISNHLNYFERHRFNESDIEAIMGENAIKMLGVYHE